MDESYGTIFVGDVDTVDELGETDYFYVYDKNDIKKMTVENARTILEQLSINSQVVPINTILKNASFPIEVGENDSVTYGDLENWVEAGMPSYGNAQLQQHMFKRGEGLEENDVIELKDMPESHNSILELKDITDMYESGELFANIENGLFKGIFPGCYFYFTTYDTFGGQENKGYYIVGNDPFLGMGDTKMTQHHCAVVPMNCFKTTAKMNSSNTTEGGYVGSEMFTTTLPVYEAALESVLGEHMLTWRDYLTTTVNTSAPSAGGANLTGSVTNGEWMDCKLRLLNEVMIYGTTAFSSSGRDVSMCSQQLPLFRLYPQAKLAKLGENGSRQAYWTSAVASGAYFAGASYDGIASYANASSSYGVRPLFLIG